MRRKLLVVPAVSAVLLAVAAPSGVGPVADPSAEEVQQLAPAGTPVVKAFNTTFAASLARGEVKGQPLDVLIAGDDPTAKQKVATLVSDRGLRPIDVEPLHRRTAARTARLPPHRDPATQQAPLRQRHQAPLPIGRGWH